MTRTTIWIWHRLEVPTVGTETRGEYTVTSTTFPLFSFYEVGNASAISFEWLGCKVKNVVALDSVKVAQPPTDLVLTGIHRMLAKLHL